MLEECTCELCRRKGITRITQHHLIPREVGGQKRSVAMLCEDCHKQIHALYSNKELAMRLNSIEALEKDERVARYLKYIRTIPPIMSIKIKKSRELKKKAK